MSHPEEPPDFIPRSYTIANRRLEVARSAVGNNDLFGFLVWSMLTAERHRFQPAIYQVLLHLLLLYFKKLSVLVCSWGSENSTAVRG